MRVRAHARVLLAVVVLLAARPVAAEERVTLELPDGRRVPGERLTRLAEKVILATAFGELVVARELLRSKTDPLPAPPPPPEVPGPQVETTQFFELHSDLSPGRTRLYADTLDAYFEWLIGAYGLDVKRIAKRGPYPLHVFRSRRDFKEVQARVAPGIAAGKGQAFAEGVAGFHSGRGTYLWDTEGERGGARLTVGKHEVTHLLNTLWAERTGIRFPVWFEEGTATYFSAAMTYGGTEPEDNLAALATVLGDLRADRGMANEALRSVPYKTFYGREYSWGWAIVRFLRREAGGRRWAPFLKFMRSVGGMPPPASETRRFLKTVGYRKSEAFDRAWHAHLTKLAPKKGAPVPLGASAEAIREVEGIGKPTRKQARTFARVGVSLAERELARPAIAYLRAALRGGEIAAEIYRHLAAALALEAGCAPDDLWPDEAVRLLRRVVALEPLQAAARRDLGEQVLLAAESEEENREARDQLGLAFLLAGPDDDAITLAHGALRGLLAADGDLSPRQAGDRLVEIYPERADAIRTAHHYYLQDEELWDELVAALEQRFEAGDATPEDLEMLAGLYRASDRLEDAVSLYARLLEENPAVLHYHYHLVSCLAAAGRGEEAAAAKRRALAALDEAPGDHEALRRRIADIRVP